MKMNNDRGPDAGTKASEELIASLSESARRQAADDAGRARRPRPGTGCSRRGRAGPRRPGPAGCW